MTLRLQVRAIGFAAPGVEDAAALERHLGGSALDAPDDWRPVPKSLSRRQLQRMSDATRVAILAAEQITDAVPDDGAWVFASSIGEGSTLDLILRSLAEDEVMVQPLRFQNAVHNTAQGQWSIIAHAKGAATSIAAYDDTAGAGLLKAAMQATLEETALGLVIYDAPLPPPLHVKRPISFPMAAALALDPVVAAGQGAVLDLEPVSDTPAGPLPSGVTPHLTGSGNPTRAILPLLKEVFHPSGVPVTLSLTGGSGLRVKVSDSADAE